MTSRNTCPVCKSGAISTFLSRSDVPVHQNLVIRDQESAKNVTRGDLRIAFCKECGFVFNEVFDPLKLSYGPNYDNTQTFSPSFDRYISGLAQSLLIDRDIRNCRIVEVGCGKGLFLRKLIEAEGSGNTGYGFDPSYTGPLVNLNGRLRFERGFYGPGSEVSADVIICRHVIEHVPDPLSLLKEIRIALENSPCARVFFETPCAEWILRNLMLWDFFYEHCSYFTKESLATAFEIAGFIVEDVARIFGGQYLWLEATISAETPSPNRQPCTVPELACRFATFEEGIKERWKRKFQEMAANGRIALWGAGAKGVTLANLIDQDRRFISCVIDINPRKQGCYLPGTGHPIVSSEELRSYNIETVVVTNPNYIDEISSALRDLHLDVDLVNLMEFKGR